VDDVVADDAGGVRSCLFMNCDPKPRNRLSSLRSNRSCS
jgi:hypothetical protein